MNKRQWLILVGGVVATGAVLVLGMTRFDPPIPVSRVEHADGSLTLTYTDATLPSWAGLSVVGLLVLTGVLIFRNRSPKKH